MVDLLIQVRPRLLSLSLHPPNLNLYLTCYVVLDDSASEVSTTDFESEIHSAPSSDHAHSPYPDQGSPTTPKADRYPSAAAARRAQVFVGAQRSHGGSAVPGAGPGYNGAEGYGGQGDMMLGQERGQGQGRVMPASPRPEPTRAG